MSEAFAESSAAVESTEQELPSGPAPEDTLGAGIFEESANLNAEPGAAEEQPQATDTLAAPVEDRPTGTIDNESLEQQGLRQADYTKKTEQLAREREDFASQRAEVEQMRSQLIQQQTQQSELLQRMTGQVEQQNATPTTEDALQQQVNNAQTYEERQHAENTLRGYQHLQEQNQNQITAALAQQREEILSAVQEQYGRPMQDFTNRQNEERVAHFRGQAEEARAAYGEDVDRPEVVNFIRNNLGEKGADGQPLTIAQLVGMKTGKPAAERQEARAATRQQRFVAKGNVTPQGAQGANVTDRGGPLSRAEALAIIESTPFPGTAM
jgi:hypothetical protein